MNTFDPLVEVPLPDGAEHVHDWEDEGFSHCDPWRPFTGPHWPLQGRDGLNVEVYIAGTQEADGSVTRWITVGGLPERGEPGIDAELGYRLSQAIREAAEKLDRWAAQ